MYRTRKLDQSTPLERLRQARLPRLSLPCPFGVLGVGKPGKEQASNSGRKLIPALYLGPTRPRGGGHFAYNVKSKQIEVFSAFRGSVDAASSYGFKVERELLLVLAQDGANAAGPVDPERPVMWQPPDSKAPKDPKSALQEGVPAPGLPSGPVPESGPPLASSPPGDVEMEPGGTGGFENRERDELFPPLDEIFPPSEPDVEMEPNTLEDPEDAMILDGLRLEMQCLFEGPDVRTIRSVGGDPKPERKFKCAFGGSNLLCTVPANAVCEMTGEILEPTLLEKAMKLELNELESFGVGKVVSRAVAFETARKHRRRVLTSRWVLSVKSAGLYRARLVVRDYASCGGSTLDEGIYSPTTSLEGLRLVLSFVCQRGDLVSADVSVAFMHAKNVRPEAISLPGNIVGAKDKDTVYVLLDRAMNGLRSAPLAWYQELRSRVHRATC